MPTCLVILAPGAEEIEFITVADILVRAGVEVTIAGAAEATVVTGSRGIPLAAQTQLDRVATQRYDCVYLPGGLKSAERHRDDPRIQTIISDQLASGRLLGVICAAPIALVPKRLCAGRVVTSYPGTRSVVEPHAKAWLDQPVVEDGNLVTSQGAGTAMALGLTLARRLVGASVAVQVARDIVAPHSVSAFALATTSAQQHPS